MRLLFTLIIVLFLFSCSSKVEVAATESELDSLINTKAEKLPVFKDNTLSDYVSEYDKFINEYLIALKSDDGAAIKKLQEQSKELTEKAIVVSGKLETAAQLETFQKWMQKEQEKIKLLNKQK